MKGLIVKDFLILRGQARIFAVITVLYFVMGVVMKDFSFFTTIILLVAAMLVVTTCAYDDSSHWNVYAETLPVKKSQIVLSKYISSALFILLGVGIGVLFNLFSILFGKFEPSGMLFTFYIASVCALLFVAVMLPIIYKFGVEKSRLLLPILVVLLVAVLFALKELGIEFPSQDLLAQLINISMIPAAVLFVLSYLLSCRIYTKQGR